MRYIFLVIIICLISCSVFSYDLEELISECFLDGIDESFRNVRGSDNYINKFELTEDEITMLGLWGFDSIVAKIPKERKYGAGIGITFYPNRYFKVWKDDAVNGQIRSTFGTWKVVNKTLYVRFEAKLIIVDRRAPNDYDKYNVEYCEDTNYYPIFNIPRYEKAYYNLEAFKWTAIPVRIRDFFEILVEDGPRSRLLFDTLGDPPGNIQPDSKFGRLLLNPQKTKEYYVDLLEVW